jgi:hypothetical protein
MPMQQNNEDNGEMYGQEQMIQEQKWNDYEHEMGDDLSPDRNGNDTENGTIQQDGPRQREEDEDPIQEKIAKII